MNSDWSTLPKLEKKKEIYNNVRVLVSSRSLLNVLLHSSCFAVCTVTNGTPNGRKATPETQPDLEYKMRIALEAAFGYTNNDKVINERR